MTLKAGSILVAEAAYHAGQDANNHNMQRVVPKAYTEYSVYWLAGYDNKPYPADTDA